MSSEWVDALLRTGLLVIPMESITSADGSARSAAGDATRDAFAFFDVAPLAVKLLAQNIFSSAAQPNDADNGVGYHAPNDGSKEVFTVRGHHSPESTGFPWPLFPPRLPIRCLLSSS